MHSTSPSLLERLRGQTTEDAWQRFVHLYTPLLLYWAQRLGLQEHDAADLVQDVLLLMVRKLPEFQYQPGRSFRGWMRTILLNKGRARARLVSAPYDSHLALAVVDDANVLEEQEYQQYVVARALRLMQTDFEPATWQACWATVAEGRPAAAVAAELGMSTNAVYLARARVLARLRRDLDGLLD